MASIPYTRPTGRGDLAQVARGFGLNGTKVTSLGQFEGLFRDHKTQDRASLWDVDVDDLIPSRNFRRVHYGEA
jgi:acetolactate synthase-1/2/3 large subunit